MIIILPAVWVKYLFAYAYVYLTRISFALHLIQLRLNNKEYLQAHTNIQPCLRRLLTAINRCKGQDHLTTRALQSMILYPTRVHPAL